jgi:hypothetical protein
MAGGGHVIIRLKTREALSDPLIHGALPTDLRATVDAILAKADADWTHVDCIVLNHAHGWALRHL